MHLPILPCFPMSIGENNICVVGIVRLGAMLYPTTLACHITHSHDPPSLNST